MVVLLDRAARRVLDDDRLAEPVDCDIDVEFAADGVALEGHLHLPDPSAAVVVFAHGSGSSRHSPRNRLVADVLYDAGIGTFLLDLLTPSEENDRRFVFDVDLLARRLVAATTWVRGRHEARDGADRLLRGQHRGRRRPAGRGRPSGAVSAVVSRGGRPDLALARLPEVTAPTLLIVGSEDVAVLDLNRTALDALGGPAQLAVVEGATHLFEEPGTLAEAAILARDWFARYLLDDRVPA